MVIFNKEEDERSSVVWGESKEIVAVPKPAAAINSGLSGLDVAVEVARLGFREC